MASNDIFKDSLKLAMARAEAGEVEEARRIIKGILESDKDYAIAWGVLARLARNATEKRMYLQEVLRIKPGNEWASTQLVMLAQHKIIINPRSEMELASIRQKSYVGPAIIVFVLYLVGYIPGLVANVLYYNEAKKNEELVGEKLYGSNILRSFLYVFFWIPVPLLLIFGILAIIGLKFFG